MRRLVALAALAPSLACGASPSAPATAAAAREPAPVVAPHDEEAHEARQPFAVFRVDDREGPIDALDESALPAGEGFALMSEPVLLGKDHIEVRRYVRLVCREGEAFHAAASRLAAWLAKAAPGRAFAVAPLHEHGDKEGSGDVVAVRSFTLAGEAVLTTSDLTSARSVDGPEGGAAVAIELAAEGAKRFEEATREWGYRRLAIVLDDKVTAVPTVVEPIVGGKLQLAIGGPPAEQRAHAEKLVAKLVARMAAAR